MSVFTRSHQEAEERSINYQQVWGAGGDWQSRLSTNPDQAMRLAAVRACVRLISDSIASMPLDLYRRLPGATPTELPPSTLLRTPSTMVSAFDWLIQCVVSLLLDGNAYGLITSRRNGWPTSIEWLDPRKMEVERVGFRCVYKYDGVEIAADDIMHIRNIVLPGEVKGVSVVEANADVIRLGLEAQKFALNFFLGGGHPTSVIETDAVLQNGEAEAVSQRFVDKSRRRGPVAMGNGFKLRSIQSVPDVTTIEIQRNIAVDVARCFGLNPVAIGASGGNSMTYTSVEMAQRDMAVNALRPIYVRIERALTACHPAPQYVKFNADSTLSVDTISRYKAHAVGIASRFLLPDEARNFEDLAPIPGGDKFPDDIKPPMKF